MQSEKEFISTMTVENTTQQSISYDRTTQLDWIFPVHVNITLMVVNFWLLIFLIHYGIKNMWWRTRNKSDVLNAVLVYNSVIGCGVACIVRLVTSFVLMNIGFSNVESWLCDLFVAVTSISYELCIHLLLYFCGHINDPFSQTNCLISTIAVQSDISALTSLFF